MKKNRTPLAMGMGMSLRLGAAALLLALGGCSTLNVNPQDPLEPVNRQVMKFNEGVDAVLLKPSATFYREYVPPLMRTGVSNFFGNLGDGWSAINSLLQFKFHNAAENWLRLGVNTFFGLGGILDIASEFNIERHREDFGQTLGRWGVPAGPFIMLPLLGPSTLRDTLALPIDRQGDLVRGWDHAAEQNSLYVLRAVDVRSNLLRVGTVLEEAALDKYSFTRDAHLQRRRAAVFDSGPRSEDSEAGSDASTAPGGAPATPAVPSRQ